MVVLFIQGLCPRGVMSVSRIKFNYITLQNHTYSLQEGKEEQRSGLINVVITRTMEKATMKYLPISVINYN